MNINKISDAKNIVYGNNQVSDLYLGSKKIWSLTKEEHTIDLLPIVMDSMSRIQLSLTDSQNFVTTGNSVFLMKSLSDIKLSNLNIEYLGGTNEDGDEIINKVTIQKIDDYALLFSKGATYDSWPGGKTGSVFNEQIKLSYGNQEKTLKFSGQTDENNTSLLSGAFVNKVIKIPACGGSGVEKIQYYPYRFYDKYYAMDNISAYLIDYNDETNDRKNYYLFDNNAKTFTKDGNVKTLNDTIFSSLNVTYGFLEGTIEYTASPNNTNEFKDTVIYVNQVLIHFMQEPHNDHRIYIRRHRRRGMLAKYIYGKDATSWDYIFTLASSKIINNSTEIYASIYNNDTTNTGMYVLYPASLENEYDIIAEGTGTNTLSSETYTWDNMEFKRYTINGNSKIKFNKK